MPTDALDCKIPIHVMSDAPQCLINVANMAVRSKEVDLLGVHSLQEDHHVKASLLTPRKGKRTNKLNIQKQIGF